ETEIARFQAEDQEYGEEAGIGIKLRDDAVLPCRKGIGIKRNQQIIEESADDAAQAVDGGLRSELAERVQKLTCRRCLEAVILWRVRADAKISYRSLRVGLAARGGLIRGRPRRR